jgi:hypothetical protein
VSTGEVLFNSSTPNSQSFNGLIFEDQYLEISTQLPQNPNIYGLGILLAPPCFSFSRFFFLFKLTDI